MTHTAVICLGSNTENAAKSIAEAVESFRLIGDIEAGDVYPSEDGYYNCVASLHTALHSQDLISACKDIETALGRTPADKEKGRVVIDLDVVIYDSDVLRPLDAVKKYFLQGYRQLKNIKSVNSN